MWRCGAQINSLRNRQQEVEAGYNSGCHGGCWMWRLVVLPGTAAPVPVELRVSVNVPGERENEESVDVGVTSVAVGASKSVD